jgi:hypothetical protein
MRKNEIDTKFTLNTHRQRHIHAEAYKAGHSLRFPAAMLILCFHGECSYPQCMTDGVIFFLFCRIFNDVFSIETTYCNVLGVTGRRLDWLLVLLTIHRL